MGRCTVFSFRDDLQVVVPGGLSMRAAVGESLSVGIVCFTAPGAAAIPPKAHSHGEEVSFQVTGGCEVGLGSDVDPANPHVRMQTGTVMLMPAEQPHYGTNSFDQDGLCLRINVVTPPRQEFGSKGAEKTFYPIGAGPR